MFEVLSMMVPIAQVPVQCHIHGRTKGIQIIMVMNSMLFLTTLNHIQALLYQCNFPCSQKLLKHWSIQLRMITIPFLDLISRGTIFLVLALMPSQ